MTAPGWATLGLGLLLFPVQAGAAEPYRVRFADGAGNRCDPWGCTGPAGAALDRIRVAGGRIESCYGLPEGTLRGLAAEARRRSGRTTPDLTQCFSIDAPEALRKAALKGAPGVLWGEVPTPLFPAQMGLPDFSAAQTPLEPAPDGLGVRNFWARTGVRGARARVIDLEIAIDAEHRELRRFNGLLDGIGAGTFDTAALESTDHGLASLGIIVAADDGAGTVGFAPDAQARFFTAYSAEYTWGVGPALLRIASQAEPGTVVQLELQRPGPAYDPNQDASGQWGMVPVEWSRVDADAIRTAVALDLVVVEPSGNGFQDLDAPIYEGRFDPAVAAGALVVCAGNPPSGQYGDPRAAMFYSNTGRLCDVQGIGAEIVAPGYGDLFGSDGSVDAYTAQFAGTSAATPQVSGAAVLLESLAAERGLLLDVDGIRAALVGTGTPQAAGPNVGPLPDLEGASLTALQFARRSDASPWRGVWSVCRRTADCDAGLDCAQVTPTESYCLPVCEPFSGAATCAAGEACGLQVWGDGVCMADPGTGRTGDPCFSELDCAVNYYCDQATGCQRICSVSRDVGCADTETCESAGAGYGDWGVCVFLSPNPAGSADGGVCRVANDCISGYCETMGLDGVGVCATLGCERNRDCAPPTTVCASPPTGGIPECLVACSTGRDCADGLICGNGVCFPPYGCQADADCGGNGAICGNDGLCRSADCLADVDCGPGRICSGGLCLDDPSACAADTDCPLGDRCVGGACVAPAPGCVFDRECAADQICEGGVCVATPRVCPAHERPRNGQCIADGTCDVQADCPARYTCTAGRCLRAAVCAADADCKPAHVCVSERCVPTTCRADADCGGGFVCVAAECVPTAGPPTADAGAGVSDAAPIGDGSAGDATAPDGGEAAGTIPSGGRGCGCRTVAPARGEGGAAVLFWAAALGLTRPRKPSRGGTDRRPPGRRPGRGCEPLPAR